MKETLYLRCNEKLVFSIKGLSMLSQERQSLILDIIKEQGSVTVTRLTEILQSSESTVRRDLSYLASKGKINKVHGGATALGQEFIA